MIYSHSSTPPTPPTTGPRAWLAQRDAAFFDGWPGIIRLSAPPQSRLHVFILEGFREIALPLRLHATAPNVPPSSGRQNMICSPRDITSQIGFFHTPLRRVCH